MSDSHQLAVIRPSRVPWVLFWPAVVVAFPFALVVMTVCLIPLLLRRPKKPEKPNTTPCGSLCAYAVFKDHDSMWHCAAQRGWFCDKARNVFTIKTDPNNCSMFKEKTKKKQEKDDP